MAFCGLFIETKANLEGLDRFSASGKVTFFLFLTAVYVVSKLKKKGIASRISIIFLGILFFSFSSKISSCFQ